MASQSLPPEQSPGPADPHELLALFYAGKDLPFELQPAAADMPDGYRSLLDHHKHMTVTVEAYHGDLVDVKVLAVDADNEFYSRKILLMKKSNEQVVQFGVVRLNRRLIPPAALAEIESQQTPLGRVLIEQNVMREVKLDSLWHVTPNSELKKLFGSELPTYGRSARLHVNNESAVELLEIVAPIVE